MQQMKTQGEQAQGEQAQRSSTAATLGAQGEQAQRSSTAATLGAQRSSNVASTMEEKCDSAVATQGEQSSNKSIMEGSTFNLEDDSNTNTLYNQYGKLFDQIDLDNLQFSNKYYVCLLGLQSTECK